MNSAHGLAERSWLVEVNLASDRQAESRFFALGMPQVGEAEEAILRYPGLVRADARRARRRLSDDEVVRLGLRACGVRPYLLDRGD